ncbi:MAG: peptidyl-prolyl cis-trans isomerase [Bdellovibrionales bacterium]|nr:peptidyl-prolyl cis-trans isomerase [Bdellovibrionales bacterium]
MNRWLLCFFIFLSSCFIQKKPEPIVLAVGETQFNAQEFSLHLLSEAKNYNSVFLKDETYSQNLKTRVVENLILEELLLQWAKRENKVMSDKDVEAELLRQMQEYPDEAAFKRVFSELKLQKELLKRKIRVSQAKKDLLAQLQSQEEVSGKAIKSYYEEHKESFKIPARIKLQQIVLANEFQANKVFDSLKNGSDFEQLAKSYSIGEEGQKGGHLGWVDKGTLPVFDAVFKIPIKRVSKPQKSPYGYHIFRLLDRVKGRQKPFNEVKEQISQVLQEQAAEESYKSWLEKQLQLVSVRKNDESIKNIQIDIKSI